MLIKVGCTAVCILILSPAAYAADLELSKLQELSASELQAIEDKGCSLEIIDAGRHTIGHFTYGSGNISAYIKIGNKIVSSKVSEVTDTSKSLRTWSFPTDHNKFVIVLEKGINLNGPEMDPFSIGVGRIDLKKNNRSYDALTVRYEDACG